MKKTYNKPEVVLIDLLAKERLMNAEDEAILFGNSPFLENDKELSVNIWDE